jgi:DNA repair protein SbcD/Mre11
MSGDNQGTLSAGAVLLAIGDVHLGTRCTGLPDDISSWGIEPNEISPAAGLRESVEIAIKNKVDAVLFAGDVVESTNARFEALVPLEENIRRLLDANIQVIAVAGNHDVEALPRLAKLIDGFELLGSDGEWESVIVSRDGQDLVEIVGWSFGEPRVRQSPVAQLLSGSLVGTKSSLPRIGLLHADLGAAGGHYAPIKQTELDQTGFGGWLLGHIHKPSFRKSSTGSGYPSGYLGSLVSLDPSETGAHGPWLITVGGRGDVQFEQHQLSQIRREKISVDISGIEGVEDVPELVLGVAESRAQELASQGLTLRALGLRIRLEGVTEFYKEISDRVAHGDWNGIGRVTGQTCVFINKFYDGMELGLDLAEIAKGDTPPALMARQILSLQGNDEDSAELIQQAKLELSGLTNEGHWSVLKELRTFDDPISDEAVRILLINAGKVALNATLNQQSMGQES